MLGGRLLLVIRYLSGDSSIIENIGWVPQHQIDLARVKRAAEQAQLASFIEASVDSSTVLSVNVASVGGAKGNVSMARALYKQASLVVFDEATSALDNSTEQAVIDRCLSRQLCNVIIRLSSVQFCDPVVKLTAGRVKREMTGKQAANSFDHS